MKKLMVLFAALSLSAAAYATPYVWRSSNTATADTAKTLCSQNGTVRHALLHNACVNTGAAGTLTLFNGWSTGVNPIAAIDTTAKGCTEYDVLTSSGLTYTNSATANVTITFDCP